VTEEVTEAIEEVRGTFPDHQVEAQPSPDGGGRRVVIVQDLDPGRRSSVRPGSGSRSRSTI
jgi:hypothetical protein